MAFVDLFISTLTQGFIYALLSYGVYITYKILDFPDLTVDGSFPLGAAITAVLLVSSLPGDTDSRPRKNEIIQPRSAETGRKNGVFRDAGAVIYPY